MGGDHQCSGGKEEPSPTVHPRSPKRIQHTDATFALSTSHGSKSHQVLNVVRSNVKTTGYNDFLATDIEGRQFHKYIEEIWSCLLDDDVFRIGIHGIGGVGKTEVAKHIHNKLLQTPNKFHHVFWVELSPGFGIHDLQSSISDEAGLDLSDRGNDLTKRARQLSKCLAGKKKSVLILDGVWDYIPLQEVGIPVGADGCTVVFTTRSLRLCRQFGCERKIEIRCLPLDESYELFKKILGKETILSSEVEKISRSVADRCVGLPLAITIMAGYMRGITDIWEWENALRGGNMQRKVDTEIFQKLKVTYDHYLKDAALQHCFLCCPSLFHEFRTELFVGYSVFKKSLLDNLVDEGIIKRTSSRKEVLGEVQEMVNFLRDVGLLEIAGTNEVRMNTLIRNMALRIMEENNQRAMIENRTYLKYLPDEESWTDDLVRVSLSNNEIDTIPPTLLPSCSKLSTLLLRDNHKLRYIGDKFFSGMPGLKVLDLSFTNIENLPSSISELVNLTALILSMCRRLREFPSLGTLLALEKLDLSFSGVVGVAKGIRNLSKLTYLDLRSTKVELECGVLKSFSHLQFLKLPMSYAANGEEVGRLSRLENVSCYFSDVVELNNYLLHLKEREAPRQLNVVVGPGPLYIYGFKDEKFFDEDCDYDYFAEENKDSTAVSFDNCSDINKVDMLIYFEEIVIVNCNIEEGSLCSAIKGATGLEYISIRDCDGLKFLCSPQSLSGGQGILEKVRYMELLKLKDMSVLFSCKKGNAPSYGSCFSNLTRFLIQGCPNMKRLFPFHLLQNLENLEQLYVIDCVSMEEIFAAEEEESSTIYKLPKLSRFEMVDLPSLKRIFGRGLKCVGTPRCSMKATNCASVSAGIQNKNKGRIGSLKDC